MTTTQGSHTARPRAGSPTVRRRAVKIAGIAADFALPVVVYYGLRHLGVGVYVSLLAGAVGSALSSLVSMVRHHSIDGVSAYMTAMMVGSVLVSLVSGSTRFLLAREALLTGVTGVWFVASIWARRPLSYLFSRPLLEGRFHWPGDWERLWETAPRFRRMWRISSVLFGAGTLTDAVVRVVMAYTLRPDVVPALATALSVVTSVVLLVVVTLFYIASGVYRPGSALYQPDPADRR